MTTIPETIASLYAERRKVLDKGVDPCIIDDYDDLRKKIIERNRKALLNYYRKQANPEKKDEINAQRKARYRVKKQIKVVTQEKALLDETEGVLLKKAEQIDRINELKAKVEAQSSQIIDEVTSEALGNDEPFGGEADDTTVRDDITVQDDVQSVCSTCISDATTEEPVPDCTHNINPWNLIGLKNDLNYKRTFYR
jgi:hypothetical protein